MPSSMTSSQIPFRPTHHPLPREEQTQGAGAGANKPEIPSERSETAVDPQNTETINLGSRYESRHTKKMESSEGTNNDWKT